MKGVILNEKEILNKALNKENIENVKSFSILRILAKHYFDKNYEIDEVVDLLNKYMKETEENYNEDKISGRIKGLVKGVKRYNNFKLVDIQEVTIRESEWNKIISLNNKQLEKLAFTLLVYQKINEIKNPNSNGWINQNITDIFKESSLRAYGEDQKLMLHNLYEKGFIKLKQSCDSTGIKLTYNNKEDENIKIVIDNFINIISYYEEYKNNEKWKECIICGKRFKVNSNKQCYCKKCGVKQNILKTNKNKQKY